MEAELQALLAPVAAGRVFWGQSPQGTLRPYVVLRLVSQVRTVTQDGLRPGLVRSRVQADCYGESPARGFVLAKAVIAAVEGRRVPPFQGIFIDQVRDLSGPDAQGNGVVHRRSVDLMIHHRAEE